MSSASLLSRRFAIAMVLAISLVPSPLMARTVPTEITRATLERLQEDGYSLADIFAAESLAFHFDADFTELLEARRNGASWFSIVQSLDQRMRRYEKPDAQDIITLLEKGYGAKSLVVGNMMADRFGFPIEVMMVLRQDQPRWMSLFETLYTYEQSTIHAQVDRTVPEIDLSAVPYPVNNRLSSLQITHHLSRGLNSYDLGRAVELSGRYHVDVDLVAAVKSPTFDWGVAEKLLSMLISEK